MLSDYAAMVFDCDGVVLDSNRVKTEAFHLAALPYGTEAAAALVAYHVANGGISRYLKFQHFLEHIVPAGQTGPGQKALLATYAGAVREGLMACAVAEGLEELRSANPNQRWLIASGGDQAELRDIFTARGLAQLFDGGIFGSPDSKDVILAREQENGNIPAKALFLGDSRYDHIAASQAGLDFTFISGWSEFSGWQDYVARHQLPHSQSIRHFADTAGFSL